MSHLLTFPSPPPKESWRGASTATRSRWKKDFYVDYPAVDYLVREAFEKLAICAETEEPDAMMIIAGSGSGKSHFTDLLHWLATTHYPPQLDPTRTQKTVLILPVPEPATGYHLCLLILKLLGDPEPERRAKDKIYKFTERMLRECGVRLILVDNFQDVPMLRAKRGIEKISSRYRDLIDASNALWVFLGTEKARAVRNDEEQLIKRIPFVGSLPYFDWSTSAGRNACRYTLTKLDAWLPLAERSCITQAGIKGRIIIATAGIFDRIVKLSNRGWRNAIAANRETMIREDLKAAYDAMVGRGGANPFDEAFVPRWLDKEGEPYEFLKPSKRGVHVAIEA